MKRQEVIMNRASTRTQGDINWEEISRVGQIYVSSEVIMYSINDIKEMTGWSLTTVQKLFNDPSFPSIDYGKQKLVENHALMQFLSVRLKCTLQLLHELLFSRIPPKDDRLSAAASH